MPLLTNAKIKLIIYSATSFNEYGKPIIESEAFYNCYWTDKLEESDVVKLSANLSASNNYVVTNITSKCQINDKFNHILNKECVVIIKDDIIYEPVIIEYDNCIVGSAMLFYLQKGSKK